MYPRLWSPPCPTFGKSQRVSWRASLSESVSFIHEFGLVLIFLHQPSSSRRSASQCRQMALDIIKLYISLLSEFFILSDVLSNSSTTTSPPHLPSYSNSLTTAHWLTKILSEVHDCVTEISALELGEGGLAKELVESVRWRFTDVLVRSWMRGMRK